MKAKCLLLHVCFLAAVICICRATESVLGLFPEYKIVQTRVDDLEKENKALKDCQCLNKETTPAFSTVLTRAQRVSINAAIKFDKVVINIQNGYDPHSGIFTVPTNGVYHISTTVMNAEGQRLSVSLYHNDVKITSIYINPKDLTFEMGTTNMVLDLKAGDKITVRSRGNFIVHSNSDIYSTFSGYLISK